MREREGRVSFQPEKQNEPIDPEQCVFSEASFRFWDDEFPNEQSMRESLGSKVRIYGACDPSLNDSRNNDYSAIVIIAYDPNTKIRYVLAADVVRRKPDQTIERIIDYANIYNFSVFGIESNQFQQLMVDNLKRRMKELGIFFRIDEIKNRANKQSRIYSLEPEITQGLLRFRRQDQKLIDQLRSFPLGSHDDGPDALEMVVELSRRSYSSFRPQELI